MSPVTPSPSSPQSVDEAVESACARFEAALKGGSPCSLEQWLPEEERLRSEVLVELARLDLEYRVRGGESAKAEDYLPRYPDLRADPARLLRLLDLEWKVRRVKEPGLSPEEYWNRFLDQVAGPLRQSTCLQQPRAPTTSATPTRESTLASLIPPTQPNPICPVPSALDRADNAARACQAQPSEEAILEKTRLSGSATDCPKIPGYEILEEIGQEGGMGRVYKARQVQADRIVALKMIKSGVLANQAEVRQFRTEVEAVASLSHPHVVQIFEVGDCEGYPFYSMEFCPGGSLGKKLASQPLPPLDAAVLIEKLARGMEAVHAKGVIHRDLKPANVLLAEDGTPKITDFGLAKKLSDVGQTQTGAILGTPPYMSPEQASGRSKEADQRTDVHALGAILYECLTGRPPFMAATLDETLRQVRDVEPVAVRQLQPTVPRDLETICHCCLQKEPGKRYQSAAMLVEDLRRLQRGEPIKARPVDRLERAWKWCRREPRVASLVSTVAVLLLGGIVIAWALAALALREKGRANREAEDKGKEAAAAREAEKTARANEEMAEMRLYASQLQAAQSAWEAGSTRRAWELLNSCRWDFRGIEHRYLFTLFNRNQVTLKGHAASVRSVAFSQDGSRIVSGSKEGSVKVWDALTGRELLNLVHPKGRFPGDVTSVALSSDGTRIVSAAGTVKVWDAHTGREVLSLNEYKGGVHGVQFSPDGKRFLTGSDDHTVKVWDTHTGKIILSIEDNINHVKSMAMSPDGKRIVSSGGNRVKVWDAETGRLIFTMKGHRGFVTSLAFSPDGKRIVSGSRDWIEERKELPGEVIVWDAETGQKILSIKGHARGVQSVAVSPDGSRIISGSEDTTVQVWDARTGLEIFTLKGHIGAVNSVAVSPDGGRIVSGSGDSLHPDIPGELKVWDARTGPTWRTIQAHKGRASSVAFSPDGSRIASSTSEFDITGAARIWNVRTGQRVLDLSNSSKDIRSVAYSPDGEQTVSAEWRTVVVRNALTGKRLLDLEGHTDQVNSVAYSMDGTRVVSGSCDKRVKVWDAQAGKEIHSLEGHSNSVSSVAFSPNGKQIASASWDSTVKVWDAETGQETFNLTGHIGYVYCLTFSPNGKHLVSGSEDRTVKVWDIQTGKELHTLKRHKGYVYSVAVSPDSKRILSGCSHGVAILWDLSTGQDLLALPDSPTAVFTVAFSPDGKRIVTGNTAGTLSVWEGCMEPNPLVLLETWPPGRIECLGISPDGSRIVGGGTDGKATVWDTRTGQSRLVLGHQGCVDGMAFSPDGKWIVTGSSGKYDLERQQTLPGEVKVWNLEKGLEILSLKGHTGSVRSVAFSSDGKRIASGGQDGTVKVWDVLTGRRMLDLSAHKDKDGVRTVAFSPGGGNIVTGGWDNTGRVWDAQTGKELLSLAGHTDPIWTVSYSPNGNRIATGSADRTVKLWDAQTGKELLSLKGHTGDVWSVCYSPDGKWIASGSADRTVKLWDAQTGKELLSLKGHKGGVNAVVFNTEGSRLVSGGGDYGKLGAEMMVWDACVGQDTLTLPGHRMVERPPDFVEAMRYLQEQDRELLRSWARFDPVWHTSQLDAGEDAGNEFAATFHLDRLLRHQPWAAYLHVRQAYRLADTNPPKAALALTQALLLNPRVSLWPDDPEAARRGKSAAEREDWPLAARLLKRAIWQDRSNPVLWGELLLAQTAAGLHREARRTAGEIIALLPAPKTPQTAATLDYWLRVTQLVCTPEPVDAARLEEHMRLGVARERTELSLQLYGVALYRAGKKAEAATVLAESVKVGGKEGNGITWVFQAMAAKRLGQHAEAAQLLKRFEQLFDQETFSNWQEQVIFTTLLTEARQVVSTPPSMPGADK